MLSVIITAKDEEKTIGRAIQAFLGELQRDFEIIVAAPDRATLRAARESYRGVRIVQDMNRGKAMALNLALREARGERLIFSDGDVEIERGALEELIKIEGDLVTGRPVSINDTQTMFGWWQKILVDMAHRLRQGRHSASAFLLLSGYLFAAKRRVFDNFTFPPGLLAEDEYLSYWAWQKGWSIKYAERARVGVKYADCYKDWVKQKVRTLAGGYQIPREWKKGTAMRSFLKESLRAGEMWKNYVHDAKSAMWLSLLFLARLDVWLRGFIKVRVCKQTSSAVWQRVPSTK